MQTLRVTNATPADCDVTARVIIPKKFRWALAAAGALFFSALIALAEPIKNADCLECHSDKTLVKTNAAGAATPLFVDEKLFATSVHRTNACVSCHADLTSKHPDDNKIGRAHV